MFSAVKTTFLIRLTTAFAFEGSAKDSAKKILFLGACLIAQKLKCRDLTGVWQKHFIFRGRFLIGANVSTFVMLRLVRGISGLRF
jgi:hypothetical protein